MTELQKLYAKLRTEGRGHHRAVSELASRLEVDVDTVKRNLRRAEQDRQREAA